MRTITDCLGQTIVAVPKHYGFRFYPNVQQYILGENFMFPENEHFDAPEYAIEVAEQMDNLTYNKLKQHITILSKTK